MASRKSQPNNLPYPVELKIMEKHYGFIREWMGRIFMLENHQRHGADIESGYISPQEFVKIFAETSRKLQRTSPIVKMPMTEHKKALLLAMELYDELQELEETHHKIQECKELCGHIVQKLSGLWEW